MSTRTTAEIVHDLASLWQILPGPANPSRATLRLVESMLPRAEPAPCTALEVALDALDRPDDGDAQERAILEAACALLLPQVWMTHEGDTCPVDDGFVVLADLGDGGELVERAGELGWGRGLGPGGAGRVRRFKVLGPYA